MTRNSFESKPHCSYFPFGLIVKPISAVLPRNSAGEQWRAVDFTTQFKSFTFYEIFLWGSNLNESKDLAIIWNYETCK